MSAMPRDMFSSQRPKFDTNHLTKAMSTQLSVQRSQWVHVYTTASVSGEVSSTLADHARDKATILMIICHNRGM
jgi:hypothetical protein